MHAVVALLFALMLDGAPRVRAIVERLASVREGSAIVARAGAALDRVRLGPGPSRVEDGTIVHLDASRSDDALAARLGHLLLHVVEPLPPMPRETSGCKRWVERVIALETRAHATEDRLIVAIAGDARAREPREDLGALAAAYLTRCASQ